MKAKGLAAVLALGLMLTATGCGTKGEATKAEVQPTPVNVISVEKGKVANEITISGNVSPGVDVAVVPKTGGKVEAVPVAVGDKVSKGDLLVRLDSTDIEVQLKSAQAGLDLQYANRNQAKIRYEDAKTNYERTKYLYDEGAVSQQQLDAAKNAYDLAKATYNPEGGNTMSDAQLNQAKASIETLRHSLSNTLITAPVDGVISARNVDPGEMASMQGPVVNIVNNAIVKVEGNLSESEVNVVKPGDNVRVLIKAASAEPFMGKVISVAPSADPRTKAFPITIEIDNEKGLLKGGMVAEVYLNTQARENVIAIPRDAVLERSGKKVVYVVKNDKVEERAVEVGISDTKNTEIVSGIEVGDQIVIKGHQLLTDQAPVAIKNGGK